MIHRRHLFAVLAATAVTVAARGQVDLDTLEPATLELESLEEGVGDIDPLAVGLRQLQVDLRAPVEFERVYRVPGREDLLMRVQGGLYAVFPRSWYVAGRSGTVPIVPNDTVFHIGAPQPEWLDRWFPPVVDGFGAPGPDSGRLDVMVGASGRVELRQERALSNRAGVAQQQNRLTTRLTPGTPTGPDGLPPGPAALIDLLPALPAGADERGAGKRPPAGDAPGLVADPDPRTLRLRRLMQRAAEGSRSPSRS